MFVHKAMTALAETCGSVSFALPGARFHCVLDIITTSGDTQLRAKVLGEGRAFEGEAHRAKSIEEMKEFLLDEGNEELVRFAIRTLWNRIEKRK